LKIHWHTRNGIYDAETSDYGKNAAGSVIAKSKPISIEPHLAKFDVASGMGGPNSSLTLQQGNPQTASAFNITVGGSGGYVYNQIFNMYPIDYRLKTNDPFV